MEKCHAARYRGAMADKRLFGVIPVLLLMAAAQPITPPPADLHLDSFYRKYLDANGIPVIGSAQVPDKALQIARDIVNQELAYRPDLRADLIAQGARVGIMAADETTMDLPEQRDWKKPACDDPRLTDGERENYSRIAAMTDYQYWAARARGMGGLYTTGAAENLLGVPGTRYYGESILIHEFSHNILDSIRRVDRPLYARVEAAFRHANDNHLWDGDYAGNTIDEYWAEGTQFWFNSNKVSYRSGRAVLSDSDLKDYDPALFSALAAAYGNNHHITADVFYKSPARITPRPTPAVTPPSTRQSAEPVFGFDIWPIPEGACVTKVAPGSTAAAVGLRSGLVVSDVNGVSLKGLDSSEMANMFRADRGDLTLNIVGSGTVTVRRQPVNPPDQKSL